MWQKSSTIIGRIKITHRNSFHCLVKILGIWFCNGKEDGRVERFKNGTEIKRSYDSIIHQFHPLLYHCMPLGSFKTKYVQLFMVFYLWCQGHTLKWQYLYENFNAILFSKLRIVYLLILWEFRPWPLNLRTNFYRNF